MATKYLTQEHLTGFEHYKYSALDTNPLSNYVMHPFWNVVVKLCPRWLAPNMLTFVGFLLSALNFLIFSYHDYWFYSASSNYTEYHSIPRWVWMAVAINHFLAHTLDGIDGKQARRTNSSSPLGELFDHGLDSWATLFIPICLYSAFGCHDHSISPFRFYVCLWSIFFTFISSHWEKYNTGVLYLPWTYDLSQIITLLVYIITYYTSISYWKFKIPVMGLTPGEALEVSVHVGTYAFSLPVSLYNIYKSYRDRTGKMRSFDEAIRPLISTFLLFLMCMLWVLKSPSDIITTDPRCFYILTGTVFSNICCRLIVSQMTNTRCDLLNALMVPVALALVIVIAIPGIGRGEFYLMYLITIYCIVAHIRYGYYVVRQMCDYFNLHCFSIKTAMD